MTTIERPMPPLNADERTNLESWLDFYRTTLAMKCDGLTEEQVRTASVPPSPLTLLGLVQHMAEVERNWFRRVLTGEDVPAIDGPQADPAGHDGGSTCPTASLSRRPGPPGRKRSPVPAPTAPLGGWRTPARSWAAR